MLKEKFNQLISVSIKFQISSPPFLSAADVMKIKGNSFQVSSITILKVDVDKNPELAQQYQIRGVPALMIFKKGQVLWKQSGVMQAAALIETLKPMV